MSKYSQKFMKTRLSFRTTLDNSVDNSTSNSNNPTYTNSIGANASVTAPVALGNTSDKIGVGISGTNNQSTNSNPPQNNNDDDTDMTGQSNGNNGNGTGTGTENVNSNTNTNTNANATATTNATTNTNTNGNGSGNGNGNDTIIESARSRPRIRKAKPQNGSRVGLNAINTLNNPNVGGGTGHRLRNVTNISIRGGNIEPATENEVKDLIKETRRNIGTGNGNYSNNYKQWKSSNNGYNSA